LGARIADAFSTVEGHISFESHDLSNWAAVYGYSISYFFVLPVLGFGLGAALWRQREVHGYRLFCLAITADYLMSVVFFLLFPVPERWAYPDSGAMLLSDRWSSTLIDFLRPISALDNCFPSTHVSFTVIIVFVAHLCQIRLRHTMTMLGSTIVLSTFVLGIHWIPDIVAGLAVGTSGVHAFAPTLRSDWVRSPVSSRRGAWYSPHQGHKRSPPRGETEHCELVLQLAKLL
jgi:membrane-associated phospholipid phosphatase